MKKVLIATAVALVTGTPLAFAAGYTPNPPAALTTMHCSYVNQHFAYDRPKYASESDYRVALQQAYSFCRQDKHKNFDRTGGNVFR